MKILVWLAALCLLAGCAEAQTMETVADEAVMAQPAAREIRLELPEETVLPVMQNESGELYICREYEVSVQTLPGGDLARTVQTISGFAPEEVTMLETAAGELTRYDLAWSCLGETGPEVGRASILSDGSYHYCLTALTAEKNAESYQEIFNGMFESFGLEPY